MSDTSKRIRVFVGSPGDVTEERDAVSEVVERLNSELDRDGAGLYFQPIRWEKYAHLRDTRFTPQAAIASGIPRPHDCDVAVFIFWRRIGTMLDMTGLEPNGAGDRPTGSTWEFYDALESDKTKVLTYRKMALAPAVRDESREQFEERQRQEREVRQFFASLRDSEGSFKRYWHDFKNIAEFKADLGQQLRIIAREALSESETEAGGKSKGRDIGKPTPTFNPPVQPEAFPVESTTRRVPGESDRSNKAGPEKTAKPPVTRWPRWLVYGAKVETVYLGASVPHGVKPGTEFVARFAAYTNRFRRHVVEVMQAESPSSRKLVDLDSCQWEPGTRVTVRLSARGLHIRTDTQSFIWNGKWQICRFDVETPTTVDSDRIILRFDVIIEGITIATLRPEINIEHTDDLPALSFSDVEQPSPRTAFASYAREDRRDVMSRVRSLQIFAGIDVFVDCLSLRPGNEWKAELLNQIRNRDIFWLFWSSHAFRSPWVEWEWRAALREKTLRAIQPHPLEPAELAPPPPELAELQFGNAYEAYLASLRSSWLRCNLYRAKRLLRSMMTSVTRWPRWLIYGAAVVLIGIIGLSLIPKPDLVPVPSRDFSISRHEITFEQYDYYAQETGKNLPDDWGWGRMNRPVIMVNLNEAKTYADWLSDQRGQECRLPSGDEWEYAARAGGSGEYGLGERNVEITEDNLGDYAWYEANSGQRTQPVGTRKPNAWGLYDMFGNAWEWCGSDGRICGGGWRYGPGALRTAFHRSSPSDRRASGLGFRVVCVPRP